jgi:signal transduction histidine kinase
MREAHRELLEFLRKHRKMLKEHSAQIPKFVLSPAISADPLAAQFFEYQQELAAHLSDLQRQLDYEREQASRARRLSQCGYWTYHIQSGRVLWSEEAVEMLRLGEIHTEEEIYEMTRLLPQAEMTIAQVWSWVHPDDLDRLQNQIAHTINTGDPFEAEYRVCVREDEVRWLRSRGALGRDATGAPSEIYGVLNDITKEKEQEQQRAHLLRLSALGEATASLAHELKAPLSALGLRLERLENGLDDKKQLEEETLRSEIHALRLIEERIYERVQHMQDYSRRERTEPPRACSLEDVLRSVWLLCGFRLEKMGVRRIVEIPEDLPALWIQFTQLEQVLVNLINNARDALVESAVKELHIRAVRIGAVVSINIRDTGCGMDAATQARLFDQYFTTKRRGEGTGLGMGIVQKIIQEHDGTIAVHSEPGQGTRVTLILPMADQP